MFAMEEEEFTYDGPVGEKTEELNDWGLENEEKHKEVNL